MSRDGGGGIKLSALYKGRPVESMTREELIAAVHELGELYTSYVDAQFETTDREMRRVLGLRRPGE